jgi:catechol-2,3-dioxygenase
MQIQQVALTVTGLAAAARYYRDVLELPVAEQPGQATVTIGSSQLVLQEGDQFAGAHHLAIGIAPVDFEVARSWLRRRVNPIVVDGSEVIEGPEGWDSRSLYFLGPEGIVLELIARDADSSAPAGDGHVPRPLSLSEVGIGVPHVADAVRALTGELGLPTFPPQGAEFAPVGGHDGLIILVDQNRIWFPTDAHQAARGPVTVKLAAPQAGCLSLRQSATVVAVG